MEDLTKFQPGIVYSSEMSVPSEQLPTLALLYERTYLPYFPSKTQFKKAAAALRRWDEDNGVLFDEGVFIRLSSPYDALGDTAEEKGATFIASITKIKELSKPSMRPTADSRESEEEIELSFLTPLFLGFHLHRRDVMHLPRIFLADSRQSRATLTTVEAFSIFRYLLPRINEMTPDDILELRRKVKDTREGFTMHLQKLSKGLAGMMKAGEKMEDLKGYAQNIVETDLIPDYREFRRQLEAEQAGKIKKVLDVTGKIMEIDAAPWTPKFWGLLLKALGMAAIETAADQKERLSNQYQAYEFMRNVEDLRR